MFKLIIHTEQVNLAKTIAIAFHDLETIEVEIIQEATWLYELNYPPSLPHELLEQIKHILFPLLPRKRLQRKARTDLLHLHLGSPRQAEEFSLEVKADTKALLTHSEEVLTQLFKNSKFRVAASTSSVIKYGSAPLFIVDLLRWKSYYLSGEVPNTEQVWGDEDDDIHLFLRDPCLRGQLFQQKLTFEICFDLNQQTEPQKVDQLNRQAFSTQLHEAGYQVNFTESNAASWPYNVNEEGFLIDLCQLKMDIKEAQKLLNVLYEVFDRIGIDKECFPISYKELKRQSATNIPINNHFDEKRNEIDQSLSLEKDLFKLTFYCPFHMWKQKKVFPQKGEDRLRWKIELCTDDIKAQKVLSKALDNYGYHRIVILPQSTTFDRVDGGVYVDWGSAYYYDVIKQEIYTALKSLGTVPFMIDTQWNPKSEEFVLFHDKLYDADQNIIRLYFKAEDLDPKFWQQKLEKQMSEHHFVVLSSNPIVLNVMNSLSTLPWAEYIEEPVSIHPNNKNLEMTKNLEHIDDLHSRSSEDDSWSEDASDWDQSELQEWLMSSLHDDSEFEEMKPQIMINYGGAQISLILWLQSYLSSLFTDAVAFQSVLNNDDMDIIIEIPSSIEPSLINNQYITDQPSSQASKSYSGSQSSGTLLEPPRNYPSIEDNTEISTKLISEIVTFNTLQSEFIWKENQRIQVNKDNYFLSSADNNKNKQDEVIFHPHFVSLCDTLITLVDQRQSALFVSSANLGKWKAITWLAKVTNTLLIEPEYANDCLEQLALISKCRQPLILVKDYDLLPLEIKASIRRSLFSIFQDHHQDAPMLLGTVSHQFYIKYMEQKSQGAVGLEDFPLFEVSLFSEKEIIELLKSLILNIDSSSVIDEEFLIKCAKLQKNVESYLVFSSKYNVYKDFIGYQITEKIARLFHQQIILFNDSDDILFEKIYLDQLSKNDQVTLLRFFNTLISEKD